jgi:hypothetical protein
MEALGNRFSSYYPDAAGVFHHIAFLKQIYLHSLRIRGLYTKEHPVIRKYSRVLYARYIGGSRLTFRYHISRQNTLRVGNTAQQA